MAELDMVNRDPHQMNGYIQVEFDDILGEPEGAHSRDWWVLIFDQMYIYLLILKQNAILCFSLSFLKRLEKLVQAV